MRMTDFIVRESVSPELKATTKEGVIREMVENMRNVGYFQGCTADDLIKAIMKREQLGSTGIGRGSPFRMPNTPAPNAWSAAWRFRAAACSFKVWTASRSTCW